MVIGITPNSRSPGLGVWRNKMAKYTIHHACGHTTTQTLFGKTADRERKIEWWESVDCPDCYKKGRAQVKAEERTKESEKARAWLDQHPELPILSGTEKQVVWADVIRAGILAEAEIIKKSVAATADKFETWMPELVNQWYAELHSQQSASWWIDHRSQTGNQVLESRCIPAILGMTFEGHLPKNTAKSLFRAWMDEQPKVIEYREKIKKQEEEKAAKKTAEEDAYIQSILSVLDDVDWKAAVRTFNPKQGGFDVHVNGHVIAVSMVNDWLEIRTIDGQNKIEFNDKFICWLSMRPEIKKVSKSITEFWMNETKSPLKTFKVGDRPGSITANLSDPDYPFLTVQSCDGRTATIIMWGSDEWELAEINGQLLPAKTCSSSHAQRIVEETRKLYQK